MRIGVLTHNYPRYSGDFSGVFVEALCRELVAQGDEVMVWAPDDAAFDRPISDRADWQGVQMRTYRYAAPRRWQTLGYMRSMQGDLTLKLVNYLLSPLLFLAGIWTVWRDARRWQPDVLHAHWLLPNGFIAAVVARWLGIPLVVSVPGSDAQVAASNPLFRWMARFVFKQADLFTANSAELRDAVVALGANPARFDMIIYGVDPERLKPSSAGVAEVRGRWARELGVESDAIYVLCVGRMVPKKGFDVLIRALAEEPLRRRSVYAIMVGNGDAKAEWQRMAQILGVDGRIYWAGVVPTAEIGVWYNACDLLTMPSVSLPADGLNVCVLDAMACGKAVVASQVAGNPLAVVQGETGFLLPEGNAESLAEAVAILADNGGLRAKLGEAGRKRVEDELGWTPLARRYRAHFRELSNKG